MHAEDSVFGIAASAVMALISFFVAMPTFAQTTILGDDACADGVRLEHSFDSGASWSLCAGVDERVGLEVRDLRYRAPGDRERPVLASLHLGQLLMHWHDEPSAERRIAGTTRETQGLGGSASLALTTETCAGERHVADSSAAGTSGGSAATPLCTRERASGLLAKYAGRRAVQGEAWELFAVARQGLLTWRQAMTLGEDGTIDPTLTLSGHGVRAVDDALTPATILATWRIAFALDSDAADTVEEYDFKLDPDLGNRRPMTERLLPVEVFRTVESERFRGWRISDSASGAGYYLDPLDSAQRWTTPGDDWARFDLAMTRARDCERLADGNPVVDKDSRCGTGLDDYVDAESLVDVNPVLWFSRTKNWIPRPEDRPFLSSVRIGMTLMPFDWTAESPFEVQ